MCWAVPTKVIRIDGDVGKVEIGGIVREVGLQFIADPQVGDYVLIHAGFAIQKVDEKEAAETLELLAEMGYGVSPPSTPRAPRTNA
jgi:hydrogenase expression/formation protein HypC